jgi:RHS repeat-associated protein
MPTLPLLHRRRGPGRGGHLIKRRSLQKGRATILPLLGERAGVRAKPGLYSRALRKIKNYQLPIYKFRRFRLRPRLVWQYAITLITITALTLSTTPNVEAATYTPVFYYYHTDNLGSSNVLTDRYGWRVQHYEYTTFGKEGFVDNTAAFHVSNLYTGQILDEETGLYYYNARYYDPELGRFIQADTIADTDDPQSLNPYSYTENNPLNFTDPTGHADEVGLLAREGAVSRNDGGMTQEDQERENSKPPARLEGADFVYRWKDHQRPSEPPQKSDSQKAQKPPAPPPDEPAPSGTPTYLTGAHQGSGSGFLHRFTQVASVLSALPGGFGVVFGVAEITGHLLQGETKEAAFAVLGTALSAVGAGALVQAGKLVKIAKEAKAAGQLEKLTIKSVQQQGREFRIDKLRSYEFDPNQPAHIRGWLKQERLRVEAGRARGPRTPPGYEQSHLPGRPARDGFDYNNSRLNLKANNQLEEEARHRLGLY